MSPTFLVIFARLLAKMRGEPPPTFPREQEAEKVRDYIRRQAKTRREREVAEYLIAAAEGRAKGTRSRGAGAGSLKHLLMTLRDNAGDLYEALATALLARVVQDPKLPLHEGLAERLRGDPLFGSWAQQALERTPRQALEAVLVWERIGGFRVAFNPTPKNLANIAFSSGADLYVAASENGAVLMARQRERDGLPVIPKEVLDAIAQRAGGRWIAPYDNLRLAREAAPTFKALQEAVRQVLGG